MLFPRFFLDERNQLNGNDRPERRDPFGVGFEEQSLALIGALDGDVEQGRRKIRDADQIPAFGLVIVLVVAGPSFWTVPVGHNQNFFVNRNRNLRRARKSRSFAV